MAVSGRAVVVSRRAEDRAALALTASEPVHLDLLDAQYRVADGEQQALVDELADHLRPCLLDAAEVWIPAGLGGHTDHLMTREAALAAATAGQRVYAYADLPYAGQPAWPADVTGGLRDRVVHAATKVMRQPTPTTMWQSVLQDLPLDGRDVTRILRLTPSQRRSKRRAVSRYTSQLAALKCGPRNPLRQRRLFAYEAYWPLAIGPPRLGR
jgi:LmbE family N-acetylglucosaminyl deacetylase